MTAKIMSADQQNGLFTPIPPPYLPKMLWSVKKKHIFTLKNSPLSKIELRRGLYYANKQVKIINFRIYMTKSYII